jgi:hypothetical protein
MHIASPIPRRLIEAISVVFLPYGFWAPCRRLALPWEPESAVDPSRCAYRFRPRIRGVSRRSEKPATAIKPSLPRRVLSLLATFFQRPLSRNPGYVTAHRRLGDLYARLILERLAMLPQAQVGIGLQLLWQLLPQSRALHRRSAGDLHHLDASRLVPSLEPALDGGAGDSKEFCDFFSRDAPVDGGKRLQSEVLRVGVHGHCFHVGLLLTQAAVRGCSPWCRLRPHRSRWPCLCRCHRRRYLHPHHR